MSLTCSLTDFLVVSQFALRNTATESSQLKHKVCEKHYFSAIVSHLVTLTPITGYLCIEMKKSSYHSPIDRPLVFTEGSAIICGHITRARITSSFEVIKNNNSMKLSIKMHCPQ